MAKIAFLLIFIVPLSAFLAWLCFRQWLLLTIPVRRVTARITDIHDTGDGFEATYKFSDGQNWVDVRDQNSGNPLPFAIGDEIELTYPQGHPGLAIPEHRWLVFEISFTAIMLVVFLAILGR